MKDERRADSSKEFAGKSADGEKASPFYAVCLLAQTVATKRLCSSERVAPVEREEGSSHLHSAHSPMSTGAAYPNSSNSRGPIGRISDGIADFGAVITRAIEGLGGAPSPVVATQADSAVEKLVDSMPHDRIGTGRRDRP